MILEEYLEMKQALQDSIEHHESMSEWVETQDLSAHPDIVEMFTKIREWWKGNNCALCQKYCQILNPCKKCPLYLTGQGCNRIGSYWNRLNNSTTWKEWLKWDRKLIKHMRKIMKGIKLDKGTI